MRFSTFFLVTCALLAYAYAEDEKDTETSAKDCLQGTSFYGNPDNGKKSNDLDELEKLSKYHVLTSIEGC